MALAYSNGMPLGTEAPPFTLIGFDHREYTVDSFRWANVMIVVFTCNHCPYVNAVEDRIMKIQYDYGPLGVQFVGIYSNDATQYPEDSFEKMSLRWHTKQINYPYLYDETQEVARAYNAACTPDFFVFGRDRKLIYNGRLDDNWKDATKVTRHDLCKAIECGLGGTPVDFEVVPSMGCSIKWKK